MKSDSAPCVEIDLRHKPLFAMHNLAIVDIDDVLADFPAAFCSFVMKRIQEAWSLEAGQYGLEDGLTARFGQEGQDIIDEFYNSNGLQELPLIPGAKEFVGFLKSIGFTLWAVTGRPGHKYSRTVKDTAVWLSSHGFQFDKLVFTKAKGSFINQKLAEYPLGSRNPKLPYIITIEDSMMHGDDLSQVSNTVFMRNRHYNFRSVTEDPVNYVRFDSFPELHDYIAQQVTEINRRTFDVSRAYEPVAALEIPRRS